MKKNIIKNLAVLVMVMAAACTYDPYKDDLVLPAETLTLNSLKTDIALDENNLSAPVLTFNWTPARKLSDDYIVTYTSKLDVVGNNFGSTTAIRNDEEDGVYSRSFTSEQINNWANDRWNLPVNKPFMLEFRVVVEFTGGPEFQAPEVRTVRVNVTPIHVDIFAADKMYIDGTATGGQEEIAVTLENPNLYAWYGDLTPGTVLLPTEFDGMTYYIHAAGNATSFTPGVPFDLVMDETRQGWDIPSGGKHRIVVDMEAKQAVIYDEATDLQPLTVDFYPNGTETLPLAHVTVQDLWAYGGGTGWGVRKLDCSMSAADPQVLIYEGSFSGSVKFCIAQSFTDDGGNEYNQNNAYCFTSSTALTSNKIQELTGSSAREVRNTYMGMPSGKHLFIFDLRNNTILAKPVE